MKKISKKEAERLAKEAMQMMLDANRALRDSGCKTIQVNDLLRGALVHYKRGRYDCAMQWCLPHMNGC